MQVKLTKKQKLVHFLFVPILSFPSIYLFYYILSYLFNRDMPPIIVTSAAAIGFTIAHWINLLYPPRPHNDSKKPKKSLKEYIAQYVIKGSTFNKIMVTIYALSALTVIMVIWLSIIGYL